MAYPSFFDTKRTPRLSVLFVLLVAASWGTADGQTLAEEPYERYSQKQIIETPDAVEARAPARYRAVRWTWETSAVQTLYGDNQNDVFNVQLPYYRSTFPGVSEVTPNSVRRTAGWRLLFKDFGTPSQGTSLPRFALYNIFTGHVKLFVYNYKPETYTFGAVELAVTNSSSGMLPNLLTSYSGADGYIDEAVDSPTTTSVVTATAKLIPNEWFYAEFSLAGYDPAIGASQFKDSYLQFSIAGLRVSNLNINGTITTTPIYEGGSSNYLTSVSSLITSLPTGALLNSIKFFTARDKACGGDGVSQAIQITCAGLQSLAPGMAGLIGWFGKLAGGGSGSRIVRYQSDVNLTGDITLETDFGFFAVRVPGTQRTDNVAAPVYNAPTGVYAYLTEPQFHRYSIQEWCYEEQGDEWCDQETVRGLSSSFNPSTQFVVNPALNAYNPTVTFAYSSKTGSGTAYVSPGSIGALRYDCDYDDWSAQTWCSANFLVAQVAFSPSNYPSTVEMPHSYVPWLIPYGPGYPIHTLGAEKPVSASARSVGRGTEVSSSAQPELGVPYPNPSSETVGIAFAHDEASNVTIRVYDLTGREVIVGTSLQSGARHDRFDVDVRELPTGVYVYRISSDRDERTGRFTVAR